jgi:O-antigen ligase
MVSELMRTTSTFAKRCYWLFFIFAVNVPGFTPFDTTGKSRNFGLFNPQSISRIIVTFVVAGLAAMFFTTRRARAEMPLVRRQLNLLVLFFILMLICSIPWGFKDLALSAYRLLEWALAIALMIGMYGSSPERTDKLTAELVFRISVTVVGIVTVFAVFAPDLAWSSIGPDTGFVEDRFGGSVFFPNTVGTLSAIALYYISLFKTGYTKYFLMAFFAATLILTYSRGALLAFVASYFFFGLIYGRTTQRLGTMILVVMASAAGLFYQDKILKVLARGQSVSGLKTASGRLLIWAAGFKMFTVHPLMGWGFIAAIKEHFPDYYSSTTFAPEHSHNELLQSLMSGGIIAGVLVTVIYVVAAFRAARQARSSLWQQFLFFAFIQVCVHAIEGPLFSFGFNVISSIPLVCITSFALVSRYGLPKQTGLESTIEGDSAMHAPRRLGLVAAMDE